MLSSHERKYLKTALKHFSENLEVTSLRLKECQFVQCPLVKIDDLFYRLPPTQDSLLLHLDRVNYHIYKWKSALTNRELPDPTGHRWLMNDSEMQIEWCIQKPAPDAVLEFVTCRCVKTISKTAKCNCSAVCLPCTNACSCSQCDNKAESAESQGEEAENDDDETSEDELDDNDV